jgi:hypothetical protein
MPDRMIYMGMRDKGKIRASFGIQPEPGAFDVDSVLIFDHGAKNLTPLVPLSTFVERGKQGERFLTQLIPDSSQELLSLFNLILSLHSFGDESIHYSQYSSSLFGFSYHQL